MLFCTILCLPGCDHATPAERARAQLVALATRLRPDLGKGTDLVHPTDALDSPMAYAFLCSAFAAASSLPDAEEYLDDAVACATWLCRNGDADHDGFVGWGLPVSVIEDDGHSYAENQEYTVTTALVINGLLDTVERIDESRDSRFTAARAEFVGTARQAALDILDGRCYTTYPNRGVAFWYSCDDYGETYEAPNVSALLAGGLQRLSLYVEGELEERFRELAAAAVDFLLGCVEAVDDSAWVWNYRVDSSAPHYHQDMVHAAFTALGLLSYRQAGGAGVDSAMMGRALASFGLHAYREEGRVRYIARYPEGSEEAQLWDLGLALAVVSRAEPGSTDADWIYSEMLTLRNAAGSYRFSHGNPATYVRAEASALLGLSEYCKALNRER